MALENINEIEKGLGLEAGKLSEMISSEESHTLDLSGLVMIPKSDYDERVKNIKADASTMAKEVTIKTIKKEFGLEFEGKTEDNLIDAFKGFVAKSIDGSIKEPEKRYTDLKTDFDTLQKQKISLEGEFTSFKTNLEQEKSFNDIKSEFTKHIPENSLVSKNTIFTEAREKGFNFVKEEGILVIKDAQGNTLKDANFAPVAVKDWVTTFVTPYLPKVEGGGGGDDESKGGKVGSFEAFIKEAEKNEWNATKQNEEMAKRIKDGTLKM